MFKVNNKNTRVASLMPFWCFIVNFEHISHLFLVFLLLTLNKLMSAGWSIVQPYVLRHTLTCWVIISEILYLGNVTVVQKLYKSKCCTKVFQPNMSFLTLFFPMFPFDPPENIRKPLVF